VNKKHFGEKYLFASLRFGFFFAIEKLLYNT